MNLFLLAILASLLFVLGRGTTRPALKRCSLPVALLGLAGVAWQTKEHLCPTPTVVETRWDEAVGHALARAVTADHPHGGKVLVLDYMRTPDDEPAVRARLKGLTEGWPPALFTPLTVGAGDVAAAFGLERAGQPLSLGTLTRASYAALLGHVPGCIAVVSFIGVPEDLHPGHAGALPPLYVWDAAPRHAARPLVPEHYPTVRAVVRTKPDADLSRPPQDTPAATFGVRYRLVTHEN